jgi:hypothetical protein
MTHVFEKKVIICFTYKQTALLFSIAEDCHMQHALYVERKKGAEMYSRPVVSDVSWINIGQGCIIPPYVYSQQDYFL